MIAGLFVVGGDSRESRPQLTRLGSLLNLCHNTSGQAVGSGLTVLNAPGTIDADYRGEVKVILANLSADEFTINDGERIAQLVVAQHAQVEWEASEELSDTSRGAGGFGSTGK